MPSRLALSGVEKSRQPLEPESAASCSKSVSIAFFHCNRVGSAGCPRILRLTHHHCHTDHLHRQHHGTQDEQDLRVQHDRWRNAYRSVVVAQRRSCSRNVSPHEGSVRYCVETTRVHTTTVVGRQAIRLQTRRALRVLVKFALPASVSPRSQPPLSGSPEPMHTTP